jgi:hypothetical protein
MKRLKIVLLPAGRLQSGAALGLTCAIAGIIAVSSRGQADIAGQLATLGVIVVAIALVLGSARMIGAATLPMLGAALIASAVGAEPAWARSIVLGILWYGAAELAWEAIERRDGVDRSRAFDDRRTDEVATVVALSLLITTAGFVASVLAPRRTVFTVGLVVIGLLAALILATRFIREAAEQQTASRPGSVSGR